MRDEINRTFKIFKLSMTDSWGGGKPFMLRILKFSKQGNEARFDRRVLFFFFGMKRGLVPIVGFLKILSLIGSIIGWEMMDDDDA